MDRVARPMDKTPHLRALQKDIVALDDQYRTLCLLHDPVRAESGHNLLDPPVERRAHDDQVVLARELHDLLDQIPAADHDLHRLVKLRSRSVEIRSRALDVLLVIHHIQERDLRTVSVCNAVDHLRRHLGIFSAPIRKQNIPELPALAVHAQDTDIGRRFLQHLVCNVAVHVLHQSRTVPAHDHQRIFLFLHHGHDRVKGIGRIDQHRAHTRIRLVLLEHLDNAVLHAHGLHHRIVIRDREQVIRKDIDLHRNDRRALLRHGDLPAKVEQPLRRIRIGHRNDDLVFPVFLFLLPDLRHIDDRYSFGSIFQFWHDQIIVHYASADHRDRYDQCRAV